MRPPNRLPKILSALSLTLAGLFFLLAAARPAQADPAGIDTKTLSHFHIMTYDSAGKPSTGEMNDGHGDDIHLYLTDETGDFVWGLCGTKASGDDPENHIFQPSYGHAVEFVNAGAPHNNYANLKPTNCDGATSGNSLTHLGESGWTYPGPFTPGDIATNVYKIIAVGVGGDQKWNPFDGNSKYSGELDITVTDATHYAYSSRTATKNSDGTYSPGDFTTVNFTAASSIACAGSSGCAGDPLFIFNVFSQEGGGVNGLIQGVLQSFLSGALQILDKLSKLINDLIIIPHSYFVGDTGGGIVRAWMAVRDITNALFILALIAIAMANILRIQIEQYDIVKALPRMVVTIIAVNLSLLALSLIIDFANVATLSLHASKASILSSTNITIQNVGFVQGIGSLIFLILLTIIGLIVILWLVLVLSFRVALILFLVIIAPIGIFFYAVPSLQGPLKAWQNNLLRFIFMGPVIAAVLWAASVITAGVNLKTGDASPLIFEYFIPLGLLAIAGLVPSALGGKTMSAFTKVAKKRLAGLYKTSGFEQARKTRRDFAEQARGAAVLAALSNVPVFGRNTRGLAAHKSNEIRGKQAASLESTMSLPEAISVFEPDARHPNSILELAALQRSLSYIDDDDPQFPRHYEAIQRWFNSNPDVQSKVRESMPHVIGRLGNHPFLRAVLRSGDAEKMSKWGSQEVRHLANTWTEDDNGNRVRAIRLLTPQQVRQAFSTTRSNEKIRRQFKQAYRNGLLSADQVEGLRLGLDDWDETLRDVDIDPSL